MSNFIVSARKYRPATFKSVVGQNHITSTLKNAITRDQLAHAYLFCGPRGVGKTTCARIFAKTINCLSLSDGEACGECESCIGFEQGRSFNIHELDAASNNSVDDIRELTNQVRVPPQIGKYSVYIIDEVHMLSQAAFNAFLKTLEEPPAHAIFILATTEKHKIIPTILSRCQIYDFNRIRVEDSVEYLKYIAQQEQVTYDDESLHLIAQKADGGMRDALSMFDKAVSFSGSDLNFKDVATTLNVLDYDTYFNITQLIASGDYPATLTLFDKVLSKGFSEQVFISGFNNHLRDLLMCKNQQTAALLGVTGTLLERYKQQGAELNVGFLFESIALLTALDGTLRTASSQRLNVELALMKLCGLGQKKKLTVSAQKPKGAEEGGEKEGAKTIDVEVESETDEKGETETDVEVESETDEKGVEVEVDRIEGENLEENLSVELAESMESGGRAELPPLRGGQEKTKESGVKGQEREVEEVVKKAKESGAERQGEMVEKAEQQKQPQEQIRNKIKQSASTKTISGASIASLMGDKKSRYGSVNIDGDESLTESKIEIDPESEQKIVEAKESFIRNLNSERPRIAQAFSKMKVRGHVIYLEVPSETFYEEIMRNRLEIITMLAEIADIDGQLDLKIEVSEDTSFLKPIKIEDRLRFLTDKNPQITVLRRALDLDPE